MTEVRSVQQAFQQRAIGCEVCEKMQTPRRVVLAEEPQNMSVNGHGLCRFSWTEFDARTVYP